MYKIFFTKREGITLLFLITQVLLAGSLFGQREKINQLKAELLETTDNYARTIIYTNIGAAHRLNPDSANYYNDIAYKLAKENNFEVLQKKTYLNKGLYCFDKALYTEAITWYEQSLAMSNTQEDSLFIGITSNFIGNAYLATNKYEKAMEYYQTSIDILGLLKEESRLMEVLSNSGVLYTRINEYDSALNYYDKALQIAEKLNDTLNIAVSGMNRSYIYLKTGKIDTSLTISNKVIGLVRLLENKYITPILISGTYSNITICYYQKKQYDKAINTAKLALAVCKKHQSNPEAEIEVYEVLAKIYIDQENYTAALNYAQKGLELVLKLDIRDGPIPFYRLLSKIYEASSQYKAALKMERNYIQLNDSLTQLQIEEKIANLEYTAKIEQKEVENALLKEEQKNLAITIQQRTYAIVVISLVLFLLGVIVTQMYFARNKLKQLYQQLKIQANQLKQNSQFKNRLFGNIAHELRTPLTIITGQLNLLSEESKIQSTLQQKVKIARESSLGLLDLTNQILDLTKSEVGSIKRSLFVFQLQDLLNHLYQQFEPIVSKKGMILQFTNKKQSNIELRTDSAKLLTILQNLLTNAIKYNNSEGIIKLDYINLEKAIKITVEDTGQGISKEDLPFIFDRYYQSKNTKISEGGIGIGLAICKEYIQLIDGTIDVHSTPNQGSIFTIQFPKKITTTSSNIPTFEFPKYANAPMKALPRLEKEEAKKEEYVLIVEDNLGLSNYLYELLQEDYRVYFAINGKDALAQIDLQPPIAIITDWMMPIMDGEALVKYLKNSDNLAKIPVLMLTARTDVKEQLSLLRIGVDDYLTKPFDADSLKAHLGHLVEQARQRFSIRKEEQLMNQWEDKLLVFSKKEQNFLKQVEDTVISNLSSFDLTIGKIANIIELSERQLSRKIKQLTKLTANQFINEIRFREAKRMLIEKEYSSVKAIMYSVGFKSEKAFSRNFKKRFGKYPKELLS